MIDSEKEITYPLRSISNDKKQQLDFKVTEAAHFVRCALKGEGRLKPTEKSKRRRRLYHKLHWPKIVVIVIYLSLTLFEKPSWCLDTSWDFKCTVIAHDREVFPPMSNIPKLPQRLIHSIEILCLLFFGAMILLRKTFINESVTAKLRRYALILLVVVSFIDNINVLITNDRVFVAQFIRPVVFILFVRSIRECLSRLVHVLRGALPVVLLILLHVLGFGWMATLLFKNTGQEVAYFPNLQEAIWNMLILLTTANFPDIMMPAYSEDRLYAIFFVVYILLGLFFLTNLMLAVFYTNYREQIEKVALDFMNERQAILKHGFDLLDQHHKGYVDYAAVYELLETIRPELNLKEEKENELIQMVDSDKNGQISSEEFEDLVNLLKIYVAIDKNKEDNCLAKRYPQCFQPGGCLFYIRKAMDSIYYEGAMNMFNLLNLLLQIFADALEYYQNQSVVYIQITYLIVYWAEMVLKIMVYGWKSYRKSILNIMDLILNAVTFILICIVLGPSEYSDTNFLMLCALARLFRVLRLLNEVEQYRVIFKTFTKLIPIFSALVAILITLFYFFSLLGVSLFGGKIYGSNPLIYENPSIPPSYVFNNFNDFPTGLLTLFELMVVNNWWVLAKMFEAVTSIWARLFFGLFYLLTVIIALNLVVSFVIDMFNNQREIMKEKKKRLASRLTIERESEDLSPAARMSSSLNSRQYMRTWIRSSFR